MSWDTLYIGIYTCIIIQIIILGFVNLFQKQTSNILFGTFSLLFVLSIAKIAFWDPIKDSFFFILFGGPHELFYGPVLYIYLLVIDKENNQSIKPHIFYPLTIYAIIHPIRILIFGMDTDFFEIVAYYLATILIVLTFYFFKGFRYYTKTLSKKLKAYPKKRFFLFYLSVNIYLLIRILLNAPLAINYNLGNPVLGHLNNELIFPLYLFVFRYVFIIPCIIFIYYAITEIHLIKKYFIKNTIYPDSYVVGDEPIDLELLAIKKGSFRNQNLALEDFLKIHGLNKTDFKAFLFNKGYSNFPEFINTLRINDFKKNLLLPEKQHFDLFSIAKESGFKSKATFYRVFKGTEGITPNEYKNKYY